jgi:hypothetical protein
MVCNYFQCCSALCLDIHLLVVPHLLVLMKELLLVLLLIVLIISLPLLSDPLIVEPLVMLMNAVGAGIPSASPAASVDRASIAQRAAASEPQRRGQGGDAEDADDGHGEPGDMG